MPPSESQSPMELLVEADVKIAKLKKENERLREALSKVVKSLDVLTFDTLPEPVVNAYRIASEALGEE